MSVEVSLRGVDKRFGGVHAVKSFDLEVPAGSVAAIIGPNGAGKSTVLKMIAGQYRPTSGEIYVGGRRVDRLGRHRYARTGIGVAAQIPRPFLDLTVRQNIEVGVGAARRGADVEEILRLTGLAGLASRPASSLGVLDLKRMEVGRALGCRPELLLLDEIAAGLVGRELDAAVELVKGIHETGVTVILVEHVEGVVESVADQVTVMNWGEVLTTGTPAEVHADQRVREIYLGSRGSGTVVEVDRRSASVAEPLLAVRDLKAGYGRLLALHGVDLDIRPGEAVAMLGANGAGKSTLCGTISGVLRTSSGTVELDGKDITAMPAHRRNEAGIAHCMEGRRLFADLTVSENLQLGAGRRARRDQIRERIAELLQVFPQVEGKLAAKAGSLSGGQQQMVAICRALMSAPRLLLCDEVSLGLAPVVIDELYDGLDKIRASGTALLIVEQNIGRCLDFADRAYVLNRGRISFSGDPRLLRDEEALDRAYFDSLTGS
ncbi:ATP-binding cassette domain-containing protein [Nocardioides sp.]|uniref:ATP-binding cassette domain-containing protein n=1 Tax=Nocardioides sp. TaxID=35761 RepID=UPI0039E629B2